MAGASDDEAQRWLGWDDNDICPEPRRAALLSTRVDAETRPDPGTAASVWALVAIDPHRSTVAGLVGFQPSPDGRPNHVGGHLSRQYRGRGLGRELFTAALTLGHRHLGFDLIRAGAQDTNIASRRSMEAAGFRPIPGAPTHTLPDGRAVPARWYEHTAPPSTCHRSARP